MDSIHTTLEEMTLHQLLFALVFIASYATALGGMLGSLGTMRAGALAALSAAAFTVLTPNWVHGVLLVLFAVAGMALFVIAAWLVTTLSAGWVGRGVPPVSGTETTRVRPPEPVPGNARPVVLAVHSLSGADGSPR